MEHCKFCKLTEGPLECVRCGICFKLLHGYEPGRIWMTYEQLRNGNIPIQWKNREPNDVLICRECVLSFKQMYEE